MLRNMKAKALALLTALAMMLGLGAIAATPALAVTAGMGSLTVTGNDKFESVDAYQMFVVEDSQADSAKYTLNSAWNGFFTNTNLEGFPEGVTTEKLSDAAFTYIKGLGNDDTEKVNAFAKTAAAWAATHISKPTKVSATVTEGTNQAVLNNLAFGYYLVVPNPKGSTPDDEHQNRGTDAMLVNMNQSTQNMELKTVYPTVDKKVGEGQNHANASVGDTLDFTLTSTVPDISEYTKGYQFSFVDTLSEGLTFNEGSVQVMIGENNVTNNCTIVNPSTGNSNVLTIHFGTTPGNLQGADATGKYDATDLFKGKAGQKITVTYTATLNEKAQIATDNTNTVKVVYSNNPNTNGTGESGESKTHQYTFKFDLNKTDGTNGLAGAVFELKKQGEDDPIQLIETSKGSNTYRPAKVTSTEGPTYETGAVTQVTTPEGGVIHFTGLDAGTYTLHEVVPPEGYNKVESDPTVTISATYDPDSGELQSWSVNGAGQNAVEVVNHAGTILPGTGGIGTVVFTVAGVVLVVAGVAWAMRRRQRD